MNSVTARVLCGISCVVVVLGAPITPPSIIHKVEPQYSKEARMAKFEGTVLLSVVIGTDGSAHDFRIVRPLGLGLDEAAVAAVSKWQFKPGVKDEQPVSVFSQIEVNFRLLEKPSWRLRRAQFRLPSGVSRPVIEKVEGPHVADDAPGAAATLTFDIDETGTPNNIQIEKGSAEDWAQDVAAALRKWRFTPPSSILPPVSCTMDFVRGN